MRALIDTNVYAALMRGDAAVARFLDSAEIVYLSSIVAGELLAGFKGGTKERENRRLLDEFTSEGGKTAVLPVGFETAERFALVKESLRKKGRPIPINDLWIAAQCLETGAVLLSGDAHFKEVEGLLIWEP